MYGLLTHGSLCGASMDAETVAFRVSSASAVPLPPRLVIFSVLVAVPPTNVEAAVPADRLRFRFRNYKQALKILPFGLSVQFHKWYEW